MSYTVAAHVESSAFLELLLFDIRVLCRSLVLSAISYDSGGLAISQDTAPVKHMIHPPLVEVGFLGE